MNLDELKKLKSKLNDKINRNSSVWKPTSGKNNIRVLPYRLDQNMPFQKLHWHWGVGNRSILCLRHNFDESCPVCEFATELYRGDDKDDKALAKKLFPKIRFYVPIVVRGEENEGPKWWSFGQQVFDSLTSNLDEVGDFTDIQNGRDVIVTYKSPEEKGNQFGEIRAEFSFRQSPIHSDVEVVKKLISEQKELSELFPKTEFDDVKKIMDKWLNPSDADEDTSNESNSSDSDSLDSLFKNLE
jgi:hypothetical protein